MAVLYTIFRWLPGAILAFIMFAAGVGPTDAFSHLSEWFLLVGVENVPSWMVSKSADKWTFLFGLIGLAGWISIIGRGYWVDHKKTKAPNHAIPAIATLDKTNGKQERVFLGESITVEYLTGLFSEPGRTTFQGQTLVKPFISKWMKISGVMKNLSGQDGHADFVLMFFEIDPCIERLVHATLCMTFRGSEIQRVSVMKPGDKFTAAGQIKKVGSYEFLLDTCELVD